ncbi:MAG: hypothetical protein AABZ06_13105, partial [Bdellovibrionota bacterium]
MVLAMCGLVVSTGCGKTEESESGTSSNITSGQCELLSGTSWVPNVTGAGASNHEGTVTVTKETYTTSGPVTGLSQAATAAREISISIPMLEDLGPLGSLSLVAEITDFPSTSISGSAYPVLVYLSDGTNEYVNLARAGSGGDCAASGYYTCTNGLCTANSQCKISWPSAFTDRSHWEQHQVAAFGYSSTATFPTCNWGGGSTPPTQLSEACAFNTNFFQGSPARLRYGVTYTAKYVLLASDYSSVTDGLESGLKVSILKKQDTSASVSGALDLNIILVGSKNITASRTIKGQQNLDTLLSMVHSYLSQSASGVKVGSINVLEWTCESGGDAYANVSLNSIGNMFKTGSALVPSSTEGKALNIFLVSTINSSDLNSNLTILGLAGAIGGPMVNGTEISGLIFSSFDKLDTFNPNCSGSSVCPLTSQESAFNEMGATIGHEIGHYLGLNHPSESGSSSDYSGHDVVLDTPICTATQSVGGVLYRTVRS